MNLVNLAVFVRIFLAVKCFRNKQEHLYLVYFVHFYSLHYCTAMCLVQFMKEEVMSESIQHTFCVGDCIIEANTEKAVYIFKPHRIGMKSGWCTVMAYKVGDCTKQRIYMNVYVQFAK